MPGGNRRNALHSCISSQREHTVSDLTPGRSAESSTRLTIALCFGAALVEGLDIVAAGIVAPKLVSAFDLTPSQAGWMFSSSTIGLLLGAVIGGWIADRIGRKKVLIASMLMFGLMSLVTALTTTTEVLFASRFLTGLGLGGAMPNLIALSAEAGPPHLRTTLVTMMFSGVPLGGAVGGAIALWGGAAENWRILFYVGGAGPLVLAILLAFMLPESRMFEKARADRATRVAAGTPAALQPSLLTILFGEGRALTTLMLWVSFFSTLIAIYLLINWLPLLLVGQGYSRPNAAMMSMISNVGGGIGAIALGLMMDRGSKKIVMVGTYVGMGLALLMMLYVFRSGSLGLPLVAVTSFAVGFFVIGAQLVLYGVAPNYYVTAVRATGVGSAVAAGRVGSVVGPLLAGQMVGGGSDAAAVVGVLLPFALAAGVCALILLFRPTAAD